MCRWLSDLALARFVTVKATTETSRKKPDSQISLRWGNVLFMSAGQIFQNQKLPKRNWRTPECKDNAAGRGQGKSLILLRDFEKSRLRRLLVDGVRSGHRERCEVIMKLRNAN